jgi:hypothetical protein
MKTKKKTADEKIISGLYAEIASLNTQYQKSLESRDKRILELEIQLIRLRSESMNKEYSK